MITFSASPLFHHLIASVQAQTGANDQQRVISAAQQPRWSLFYVSLSWAEANGRYYELEAAFAHLFLLHTQ